MTAVPFRRLLVAVVAAVDTFGLRVLWVAPAEVTTHLAHPRSWGDAVGTDAATLELVRLGLWLTAAWLAVAMVSVLGSGLPGAFGRLAGALAGRVVPAVVYRTIAATIGASVVLVPIAANARTTGGPDAAAAPLSAGSTSAPAAFTAAPAVAHVSGGWPWPTSAPTSPSYPTSAPAQVPASTGPATPVPWPRSPTRDATPTPRSADVVVRPGDCLWAIAAHRLGSRAGAHRIATESMRWYDANAAIIGADPGLIHPGQHLHRPIEKGL
jgi:hypothetical protein